MESISKSRIQGVWDPSHSTRTGIIAHSTRVVIPSGYRHFIWLPPLHPAAATFHPDVSHPEIGCRRHSIRLPPLSTQMYHIRKSAAATFHLDVSHPEICCHRHSTRMFTYGILTQDGSGERFNFPGHTFPDPLIALTRRVSQPFCTMPRGSPEASRYV